MLNKVIPVLGITANVWAADSLYSITDLKTTARTNTGDISSFSMLIGPDYFGPAGRQNEFSEECQIASRTNAQYRWNKATPINLYTSHDPWIIVINQNHTVFQDLLKCADDGENSQDQFFVHPGTQKTLFILSYTCRIKQVSNGRGRRPPLRSNPSNNTVTADNTNVRGNSNNNYARIK